MESYNGFYDAASIVGWTPSTAGFTAGGRVLSGLNGASAGPPEESQNAIYTLEMFRPGENQYVHLLFRGSAIDVVPLGPPNNFCEVYALVAGVRTQIGIVAIPPEIPAGAVMTLVVSLKDNALTVQVIGAAKSTFALDSTSVRMGQFKITVTYPDDILQSLRVEYLPLTGYLPAPWLDGVGSGWRVQDDATALMQTAVGAGNYFQGRTMDGGYGAVLGEAEPVLTPGWGSSGNPAGNLYAWSEETMNPAMPNGAYGNWNPLTVAIAAWGAPDGTTTAQMLQSTAGGQSSRGNYITAAPGDRITVSCYINNENAADVMFAFVSGKDGLYVIDEYSPNFDRIGGWVRYERTFTVQPGSNQCQAGIYVRDIGYVGVWGFQMVHGESAGAYTKTAGTPMPPGTTPYFIPGDPALGAITFVGGAIACILDDGTPPATWANGLPFSADGRLIVNGTDPLVNWVNGLPFTERALKVNSDFLTPPAEPAVISVDPFFTTALGTIWNETYWGPIASYAEADVFLTDIDTGLYQPESWIAMGVPVTFFVRLKTAVSLQSTFGMVLVADGGGTTSFIGSINIPAGQVFGTARFVLPNMPANMKNLGFGYAAGPAGGVHVESFGLNVTAADGGPPQTVDPYFSSSAFWSPTPGAVIAGNELTITPDTLSWESVSQASPSAVPGDTIAVRVYVAAFSGSPGTLLVRIGDPGAAESTHDLVLGWNAFSLKVPATNPNIYLYCYSGSVPAKIHFFIAAKV